jgi:hypothetical protein
MSTAETVTHSTFTSRYVRVHVHVRVGAKRRLAQLRPQATIDKLKVRL